MIKKILFIFLITIGSVFYTFPDEINDQIEWDAKYLEHFPTLRPEMEKTDGNDDGRFAWHAHYWIRVYVTMAQVYTDSKYLDWAVELIDHIFNYTDISRYNRGEIGVQSYASAPRYLIDNPTVLSISWRRPYNGQWRIETLTDGMICQAIMRFVDFVYSNNDQYSSYMIKATEYMNRVQEIIDLHYDLWSDTKDTTVAGSYWYARVENTWPQWGSEGNPWDDGLYNTPLPINHSLTLGCALMLLDKLRGGVPEYHNKAEKLLQFFKDYLWIDGNCYQWYYALTNSATGGIEDVGHGHIDMSFIILAYQLGYDLTDTDMIRFANIITDKVYAGNGDLYSEIDGTGGIMETWNHNSIGYDWIDFFPWKPELLTINQEVMNKHGADPDWSRPFLAWANILKWKNSGNPTPIPTSSPVLTGDVNGDSNVNIIDALLISQYYVGLNPTGFDTDVADVNCNGSIDIIDALLVSQYYVGLINNLC